MKKKYLIYTTITCLLIAKSTLANDRKELIIDDTTTEVVLDLNPQTVQCLVGDYGAGSLKIVVPQIKGLTYLDHTSRGAPGPCINAGACKAMPDSFWFAGGDDYRFPILHNPNEPTEKVMLRVIKKEVIQLGKNECFRNYVEEISANVRGINFRHTASLPLATLPLSECK